jgi:hypothetical protein
MYYLIGLLIILLIYFMIDFLYKYVDCICYQLNIFNEQFRRTRN